MFESILTASPNFTDDLYIYIAAHGNLVKDNDNKHFVDLKELYYTKDLFWKLNKTINHKHNIKVILDSCHGGVSAKDAISIFPTGTTFFATSLADNITYVVDGEFMFEPDSINPFKILLLEALEFISFGYFKNELPIDNDLELSQHLLYQFLVGMDKSGVSIPTYFKTGLESNQNLMEKVAKTLNEPLFFDKRLCVSFKKHIMRPGVQRFSKRPYSLPPKAHVVVFHGRPNPPDALLGEWGKPMTALKRWWKPDMRRKWLILSAFTK